MVKEFGERVANAAPVPRVLILEDDDLLRETLVELLREHEYEVSTAVNAREAVERASQKTFHLVLSDVRMAGDMDGVGALESIKQLQPGIRTIVMTGYADPEVPIRAARMRADNYLRKPFELAKLLEAIRVALEDEQAPFRASFSRFTSKSLHWLMDPDLAQLSMVREHCLHRLYLLIRSARRTQEEAYALFCLLEKLEIEYLKSEEPSQWRALTGQYEDLEERALRGDITATRSLTLSKSLFAQLYQKIQDGRVDSNLLQRAFVLLHSEQARKQNLESYCAYHWLWSPPADLTDPFVGLQLGPHHLLACRSCAAPGARVYDTAEGAIILCLPADQNARLFWEQLSAYHLREAFGHHFFVFPSETVSLKNHIPPEGLPPAQAWKLIRPLFQQVYAFHQQGRYSGSLAWSDIEVLPQQPPTLVSFANGRYQRRHQALQSSQAIPLDPSCAPEVAYQPEPDQASDQFVLGRLLFEVLVGQRCAEFPSAYIVGLGLECTQGAWKQMEPHLQEFAPIVYRLCQAKPNRRYPDLRQAGLAINQSLAG